VSVCLCVSVCVCVCLCVSVSVCLCLCVSNTHTHTHTHTHRYHKPSTIFLDEIDSIMSQRQSVGAEHDGGRRMKTEVLIQMDGVMSGSDLVFLLCASNLPWDLDSAKP